MKYLWIILLFSFHLSHAEEGGKLKTQVPKTTLVSPMKWKASFDSLYYDFQGRHNADGNIYGFESVIYKVQTLNMTYMSSPTLHFSLLASHTRNYAETEFFGKLYRDTTRGINDTKLKVTKTFLDKSDVYVADLALSLPTGSISEKNVNNPNLNYPYNMQLGSGTYDLEASLIYLKTMGKNQVGAFGMATVRTGKNEFDYRKGNEYRAKLWYTYLLNSYLFPGVWLNYHHIQRLTGQDKTYGRNIFVEFYHSPRHFWDVTMNMNAQYPLTQNLKLKGLVGLPAWQESKNIDNVQVYTQWFAQLGVEGQF